MLKIIKLFLILIFSILIQTKTFSKEFDAKSFNQRYFSNYFSALILQSNQENDKALRHFNASRPLMDTHQNFIKEYIFSLVLNKKMQKATNILKKEDKSKTDFFESHLLLVIDGILKKDFTQTEKYLLRLKLFSENGTIRPIIFKSLNSFEYLFREKKIEKESLTKYENLNNINQAFQHCYLKKPNTKNLFYYLLENQNNDYSRYSFFYANYLIHENDLLELKYVDNKIDQIRGGLIALQTKQWIKEKKYSKIKEIFNCNNESDILSEFFFLVSNFYSSNKDFKNSNFYLMLSVSLNPKFYPNYSLISENHYLDKKYELSKRFLNNFNKDSNVYSWYSIKRNIEILIKKNNEEEAEIFMEKSINKVPNLSGKAMYDIANFYKRFDNYQKAIEYYSKIIKEINLDTDLYADLLFRRGGSYERLKKFNQSDRDLQNSLKIYPEEPYVMNYLAYSWLERNIKIDEAMIMLKKAYELKKNDPYITDSIGWAYYLIGDYKVAERYMNEAIQLMPNDPIVNDHYGDILWKTNQKLKARYYWKNTLNFDDTEEEMKKKIKIKLIHGLKNS